MDYVALGKTGITVSRLCFGSLTLGPLQANLPVAEGAAVIRAALEAGVNFIDTAELYQTYPYIKGALRGWTEEVVVASKCYAYTREGMATSLELARRELDREVIDIFLLHEQESALTLAGHRPALEYLLEAREKGVVRAVGISTHGVAAVKAATLMEEIQVIHPLINQAGIGILDGTAAEMLEAIAGAYQAGKGIYSMKAIAGGNLLARAPEAIAFVLAQPTIHSVAIGMKTPAEVAVNVALVEGRPVPPELGAQVGNQPRRLLIEAWCQGCKACVQVCRYGALEVVDGTARVQKEKCVLCGYCGAVCRDFCIKVV